MDRHARHCLGDGLFVASDGVLHVDIATGLRPDAKVAGLFAADWRNEMTNEKTPAPETHVPLGWTLISDKHYNALAEGLAEIKATSDGQSDQSIPDIINGIIAEIREAPAPVQGFGIPAPQTRALGSE